LSSVTPQRRRPRPRIGAHIALAAPLSGLNVGSLEKSLTLIRCYPVSQLEADPCGPLHALNAGGFALVAAPAVYNVTGVRTFIVSHGGVVSEKDLGPKTLDEFSKMERFNPDKTRTPVS
jgi:hypothetical protein